MKSPGKLVAASAPIHADAPSQIAATMVMAPLRVLRRLGERFRQDGGR